MNCNTDNNFISLDELKDIKQAFDLFLNDQTGRVDITEINNSLVLLDYPTKNTKIYEFFKKLENYQISNKIDGITFDEFQKFINEYLKNSHIYDNLKVIYNLFLLNSEDKSSNTLTVDKILNICKDLGEDIQEKDIKDMLLKVSKNGKEINFDEFFDIIVNSTFP